MPLPSATVFPLLDWFIPAALRRDAIAHRRARMYLITHLFATPLGFLLALYLYVADPRPGLPYWVVLGLLAGLYAYPFLLRAGADLDRLAPLSVQHLTFVILFGAFHYGGASSPFFPWLGVIPLVSTLYLAGSWRVPTLAMIAIQILAFYAIHALGHPFPEHVAAAELSATGIISALCACMFVSLMSLHYASIVTAQQKQLEREVDNHRATEVKLRRAKEDAERADRAKSAFLANTSHELRTPLNAIIGFAEVIRSETFGRIDNPRYREYLKDIHDSGRHLLRIINDILDLSKIEAGKATLDREEKVQLALAIEAAARMVQPRADAEQVRMALELERNLPTIVGSERMLQQVFINLLSNAVKFTPAEGEVVVRAGRNAEGEVVVVISDDGIGMSDEDVEIALAAFGQVDSNLARKYSGTGLGLPLAKAITELHGGTLEIASMRGCGTRVTVKLPRDRVIEPQREAAPVA